MLVLTEAEVQDLLVESECVELMEISYGELGRGSAQNIERGRMRFEADSEGRFYFLNNISGAVPALGASAVRLDSVVRLGGRGDRDGTRYLNDRYTGLVLLFSTETGEWLATLPDFTISGVRVAATSAVVSKRLARSDATRLGVLGSGKQARSHLITLCGVHQIADAWVFSPNPDHVTDFCDSMAHTVNASIHPSASVEEVVRQADILVAATNAWEPLFPGQWLRPGMHVIDIVGGDKFQARRQLDDRAVDDAAVVVVNSIQQIYLDRQPGLFERVEADPSFRLKLVEVGDVATGKYPARSNPSDMTLHRNNTGQGIQFAATAMHLYQKARASGVGREIPTDWFLTDVSGWAAKGFYPSP